MKGLHYLVSQEQPFVRLYKFTLHKLQCISINKGLKHSGFLARRGVYKQLM